MGGRQSRGSNHANLLEGTSWLRSVVQQYQKRRSGVSSFESFVVEPFFTDHDGIEYVRVNIAFRNSKGKAQQVQLVKLLLHISLDLLTVEGPRHV